MDTKGKVREPYHTPNLRTLGTLTELTQGVEKSGPNDNSGAPYCAQVGEQPGTGGSGAAG